MSRITPGGLAHAALMALLVVLLMSFQDPFRVAFAAFLTGLHVPVWRHARRLEGRLRYAKITP